MRMIITHRTEDSITIKRMKFRFSIKLWLLLAFFVVWVGLGIYHSFKPLPEGISVATPLRAAESVEFLADYTWVDEQDVRHIEQQIFDRVLALINQAERLIVLDKFLFNDFAGDPNGPNMRPLTDQLSATLIRRKTERPDLRIVLITDPINHLYGGLEIEHLARLKAAGIEVVTTNLPRLRDSNPLWSGLWRMCCQWFGNSSNGGWLPNPVGDQKVTLRSVLTLLNFKANHRKTLIVDVGTDWVGLVTSGNPHDASSAHGNVALQFSGPAALDLLATEQSVIAFSVSDTDPLLPPPLPAQTVAATTAAGLQILTEGEIRDRVLRQLQQAGPGDRIDLAMFYLSHRGIVRSMIAAHERGAALRVLLDPNEDAFGNKKNGIPNRQVASELHQAGVPLRWCDTHGEQCHSKFMLIRPTTGLAELLLGSANFTRRNLDDFNLETNALLTARHDDPAIRDATEFFDLRWNNAPNRYFSRPYEYYADEGRLRYWRYRFMEASGLSTF